MTDIVEIGGTGTEEDQEVDLERDGEVGHPKGLDHDHERGTLAEVVTIGNLIDLTEKDLTIVRI